MDLDRNTCYTAVLARDRRFDGWFFVAVTSTGIYCRTVCPVRPPKLENCRFYPNAAAAERAGFRPCLRCRPELAPGHGLLDVSRRLAQAAAALIGAGFLNDGNLTALAGRVGVSTRHLRRIFEAEFGVSPIEYAQTQRLLLAKRLLAETALPAAQVALTSGFGSVRRFNDLFSRRYGFSPARVRKRAVTAVADADMLSLELPYRPPFAWDALLYILTGQAISGVERVTHDSYLRALEVPHDGAFLTGWLRATHLPQRQALRIAVSSSLTPAVPSLLAQVRRFFDLDCRPDLIDARLGTLATSTPGLRVPGSFDGFEIALRAIALREWSPVEAHGWLQRIADTFGAPVAHAPEGLRRAFPRADAFVDVPAHALCATGLPAHAAASVLTLAAEVAQQRVFLEPFTPLDETLAHLRDVVGLDEWSVQYIAMHALGWPNAYPVNGHAMTTNADDGERWAPWRAYAVQHIAYATAQQARAA